MNADVFVIYCPNAVWVVVSYSPYDAAFIGETAIVRKATKELQRRTIWKDLGVTFIRDVEKEGGQG